MLSKETLSDQLRSARAILIENQKELADHIVHDHRGRPPSTCHRCMTFQQRIIFDKEDVQRLQQQLEGKQG